MFPFGVASRVSFKREMVLTFVAGFLVLAAAFTTYIVLSERDSMYRGAREATAGLAQSLALSSLSLLPENDAAGLQRVVKSFRDYPSLRYAMVIAPDGRVLAHSDAELVGQRLGDDQSLALIKSPSVKRVIREDHAIIDVSVPIVVGKRHFGWARVGISREGVERSYRKLILSSTLFVLLVAVFSLFGAVFLYNRLGRRVAARVAVARQAQAGNGETGALAKSGTGGEVSGLDENLNLMLAALAQNEERLCDLSRYTHGLIEVNLDPLVIMGPEGRITDVNRATENATGRTRAELVGTDFSDCFNNPDKARSAYREAVSKGVVSDYPLVLQHRDGRVTNILYNARVNQDRHGKVQGVFASVRDITERERAVLSSSKLAAIVESSSDAIIGKTPEGIITSWNKGAERIYGYTANEVVGKHVSLLVPESLRAEVNDLMARVFREESVEHHESIRIRKDGTQFDVSVTLSPIRDATGRISGISTIAHDISRRKHLEEEFAANLHYFESMDKVNRAIQGEKDLDGMLSDVLDEVLSIFGCDRVGLVYPCDPKSPTWQVMMARTRAGYGAEDKHVQLRMTAGRAESMQKLLDVVGPVQFTRDESRLPSPEQYDSYRSLMSVAIHPWSGKAWEFGIHQCTHERTWNSQEVRLLDEIGRRLADGLSAMLAHQDLQESEQRYHLVFKNSPVSIWEEDFSGVKALLDDLRREGVTDIEAYFRQNPEVVQQCAQLVKIIDVNDAALNLHGADSKEKLLAGLLDTFTAESLDIFREELVGLWAGKNEMCLDAIVKTLSGKLRNVTVYFSVCPGYEETLSKVLVSLVDITERKQIDEDLRASEAQLRALISAMTDVIIVADSEGRYLKIAETNPSALYKPELKLVGKTLDEAFPKEQADYFISHIRQVLQTQKSVDIEYSLPIENKYYWFNATISPMSDDSILMVARDITQRKQSEEALRSSAMRLNYAQRIAHLGDWALDLKSNELSWSDEIFRIYEIDPEQFGGTYEAFLNAIHKDDREFVNKSYADSVNNKVPYDIVHRLQMPDGRIKFVNEKGETYYDDDGKPYRSVGTVHDITKSKLDEEALQRLNRELHAISNCNQVLMRAVDEQTLLHDICNIICDEAGYRMAWVGYREYDTAKTIRPVAWAGIEDGYIEQLQISWSDTVYGQGPSGIAMRTGQSAGIDDFGEDPTASVWRDAALQRGYRSSVSLPLKNESASTFGVLNIYSSETDAFKPNEIRLLEELAGDMAFGIMILRTRLKRQRAEEELRQMNERYSLALRAGHLGVWDWDLQQNNLLWDDRMYELYGVKREEFDGAYAAWQQGVHPDDRAANEKITQQPQLGQREYDTEFRVVWPNGSVHWLKAYGQFVRDAQGNPLRMIGFNYDITERKQDETALAMLNRALRMLTDTSLALIHITVEEALLSEACRIAVDTGGYRLAWIGFSEHDEGKPLRPVAYAGHESGYIPFTEIILGDSEHGNGPGGDAIRPGKAKIVRHIQTDPAFHDWREAAIQHGYQSLIVLPLISGDQIYGAMGIYSSDADAFDQREEEILMELASNLAFGITALRVRAQRIKAEAALKQSEEKYRNLIHKIQVAIVVHGASTEILTANSMAQELLGLTQEQMMGKVAADPGWHFYREDGTVTPIDEYPVNRVLSTRQPIRNLVQGLHRSNSEDDVWVLVNADPVFVKEGVLNQVIVTFNDISDRKRSEFIIAEKERQLRTLVDNLPSCIVRFDNNSRFTFVNDAVKKTFDLPADYFVGKTLYECGVPGNEQENQRLEGIIQQVVESGVPHMGEAEWQTREGKRYYDILHLPERDESGSVVSVLGIANDITERKLAEAQIQNLNQELEGRVIERTAELEAVNNELEAFSYSVSHDLRTPLRAIDGFSQILQEDYAPTFDDEGKRLLNVVRENTRRMEQLIDDILKFSRTGRLEISFSEIDMEKMARAVFAELQPPTAESKIQFEIEPLPQARGDSTMIRQIFVNLLSNAIKFSSTRETPLIKVGAYVDGNEIVYYVKDNGVGFDMQYADKLFGVFQRLHTIDEFEGTGIGLAIVKRIVSRHDGRVWAEGEVDKSATFYFSIPTREKQHDF